MALAAVDVRTAILRFRNLVNQNRRSPLQKLAPPVYSPSLFPVIGSCAKVVRSRDIGGVSSVNMHYSPAKPRNDERARIEPALPCTCQTWQFQAAAAYLTTHDRQVATMRVRIEVIIDEMPSFNPSFAKTLSTSHLVKIQLS